MKNSSFVFEYMTMDGKKTVSVEFSGRLMEAQGALRMHLLMRLGDPRDVDDVLQNANLYMLEREGTFDPKRGPFLQWAREMANHQLRKWRLQKSRERVLFSDELLAVLEEAATEVDNPRSSERTEALRLCLANLSAQERERVHLKFFRQWDLHRLAGHYGTGYGAEATKMWRICRKLHDCISGRLCHRSSAHGQ